MQWECKGNDIANYFLFSWHAFERGWAYVGRRLGGPASPAHAVERGVGEGGGGGLGGRGGRTWDGWPYLTCSLSTCSGKCAAAPPPLGGLWWGEGGHRGEVCPGRAVAPGGGGGQRGQGWRRGALVGCVLAYYQGCRCNTECGGAGLPSPVADL